MVEQARRNEIYEALFRWLKLNEDAQKDFFDGNHYDNCERICQDGLTWEGGEFDLSGASENICAMLLYLYVAIDYKGFDAVEKGMKKGDTACPVYLLSKNCPLTKLDFDKNDFDQSFLRKHIERDDLWYSPKPIKAHFKNFSMSNNYGDLSFWLAFDFEEFTADLLGNEAWTKELFNIAKKIVITDVVDWEDLETYTDTSFVPKVKELYLPAGISEIDGQLKVINHSDVTIYLPQVPKLKIRNAAFNLENEKLKIRYHKGTKIISSQDVFEYIKKQGKSIGGNTP